jgi:putative transposase
MSENTVTLVGMSPPTPASGDGLPELSAAEQDGIRELVRQARASGTSLTGPGGLLKQLTKMVVETALEEEMSEHLGYDKHAPQG